MSVELVAPRRDVREHVAREDDSHASCCRQLRRQLPPASSPGRIPVHEETERVCRDWICNNDNDGVRASTTTTGDGGVGVGVGAGGVTYSRARARGCRA